LFGLNLDFELNVEFILGLFGLFGLNQRTIANGFGWVSGLALIGLN
jgi:hypothetical protein